jgi:oligopeptide/dipeptide ABC transporter ATP-binding protein
MMPDAAPLMQLHDLRKSYRLRRGMLERLRGVQRVVTAVDGVSLPIERGSILGLVGESGCGKSTLAQMIVGLLAPSGGTIEWGGNPVTGLSGEAKQSYRRGVQMVFQDTHSSLNPRKRIRTILTEAVIARGLRGSAIAERVGELLGQVGLDAQLLGRFAHELSGGQRQRVGIARALAMEPSLLVADEPVSSLDVSLQGQIINLLRELNRTLGLTIVLISHDLAVVGRICDRIVVMYAGRVVESGIPEAVLTSPRHPYTQALLDALPRGLERRDRRRTVLPIETGATAGGCRFRARCLHAMEACAERVPALETVGAAHQAACLLRGETAEAEPMNVQRAWSADAG